MQVKKVNRLFDLMAAKIDAVAGILVDQFDGVRTELINLRTAVIAFTKPHSSMVVVWATVPDGRAVGEEIHTAETCFSIPVVDGNAEFLPQRLLRIDRWLLIGPGYVKGFSIGAEYHTPTASVVDGIVGRYGEGKYKSCDVGQRVRFQVKS